MLILFDLAGIAFFVALVLSPAVRDVSKRVGWVDRPDTGRKLHVQPVPRVGGIAIAVSYLAALTIVVVAPYGGLPGDILRDLDEALLVLPAAGVVFLTGLLDDIVGLRPWHKLLGQTVGSILAYWSGFGVYFFLGQPLQDWVSLPATVLWLVGCANAVNLIDGMDGLAAGVGFFATATMLVAALTNDQPAMAMVTAPLLGALLGFLRYNFNPASLFLGDSGSLLVGFLLGCYGALWVHKSATVLGMTAPLLALALPLLDTSIAILRRFLRSKPIFSGDRNHVHHKLLALGWTPRRTVLVLYAICGVAAGLSLLHDVAYNRFGGLIIVIFCMAAWIGVQHLGYSEFGVAGRLLFRGQLRSMIDAQLRLQQFERELSSATTIEEFWQRLSGGCKEFGLAGARMRVMGRDFVSEDLRDQMNRSQWQLRIPLGEDQYLNLFQAPGEGVHPTALGHLTQSVQRAMDHNKCGKFKMPALATEFAKTSPDRDKLEVSA